MDEFLASFQPEMRYLLSVVIALALGFAIGLERKMRYKEAGMRTHAIVCGGSALMTIISKYGFDGAGDGARVAAQIVTGIGFLGAGIIVYKKEALHGLTTAAGVWMTAGVGMAAGADMYWLSIGSTVLIIAIQCVMHLPLKIFEIKRFYLFRIKFSCNADEGTRIKELFGVKRYYKISYYNEDGGITVSADLRTSVFMVDDRIKEIMDGSPFIKSIERIEE
ncbi:MAG: MgtC/SapB family protein [Clostridiales bacterium]|jgi:putative Mg2+ transporter-C (MgtC) family protein|nr:MgtC/SapB family protein [Clostridiales bacterium]